MNCEIAKHLEIRRTSATGNIPKGISRSDNADFKLTLVLYAGKLAVESPRGNIMLLRQMCLDGNNQNRSCCALTQCRNHSVPEKVHFHDLSQNHREVGRDLWKSSNPGFLLKWNNKFQNLCTKNQKRLEFYLHRKSLN